MGRKRSKGKKDGSKKGSSDNGGGRDSEQAGDMPPPKAYENPSTNEGDFEEVEYSFSFKSIVDPEFMAYLHDTKVNDEDSAFGDRSHENQLRDSLNCLRLAPPRPVKESDNDLKDIEEIGKIKAREIAAMERARKVRANTDTSIAEQAVRLKNLITPLLPDLPTINLELQDLPGTREETPKKKPRRNLSEEEIAIKNRAKFRGTTANLAPSRPLGGILQEFEAASAVDQAIFFAASVGLKQEHSKSSERNPKTPSLFPSKSPTGTPSQPSRNNAPLSISIVPSTRNDAQLTEGRNNNNLNENPLRQTRGNRNKPSMAVAGTPRVGNKGAGIKTELDRAVDRLRNLNINENQADQITENSAQDPLQENNNIASNQRTTPIKKDLSVRKKVKKPSK